MKAIAELSAMIDSHPANRLRSEEAQAWGRLAKIGEEFGEVIGAYIGATNQNPRKGVTHSMDDVRKELLDVALTALAAYEHLTGNEGLAMAALVDHALSRKDRLATVTAGTNG
jgi:hypothetical protein